MKKLKKSFYASRDAAGKVCKHPSPIKTSFGQLYCLNCKKNIPKGGEENATGTNDRSSAAAD